MTKNLSVILAEKGLKVTIQRVAVYEAICDERTHPTADLIIQKVIKKYPSISAATVYKTLDLFAEHGIILKVKTSGEPMRYDPVLENHHHPYCAESERIEDYYDDELNALLEKYFNSKGIPGFELEDFRLQLTGKFTNYNH